MPKDKEISDNGTSKDAVSDDDTESIPEGEDVIKVLDPATNRYATFSLITWWDLRKIQEAKILVVGAGALGNEVLKNLALMGVGNIFIIDFDTIEASNFSRSILFRPGDDEKLKAQVAAQRVKEINSDVKVQWLHGDITTDLGLGVYRRMDVIIGGLDNVEARLAVNQACWKVNKPWVDGAIEVLYGLVRVFVPGDGACYECTLSETDRRMMAIRKSCRELALEDIQLGRAPTTPTISSIIAGIQTQEALKIIHKMEVHAGKVLIFNGLVNDVFETAYPYDEGCLSHETYGEITELEDNSVENTTFTEMLDIAKTHLGNDAHLELDHDVIQTFKCRVCDEEEPVFKLRDKLPAKRRICPTCGKPRQRIMTHTILGKEAFLDKTLADIGIPPLHIIQAQNGEQTTYFELTGDVDTVLAFN